LLLLEDVIRWKVDSRNGWTDRIFHRDSSGLEEVRTVAV
jgi:hypothetical protein